MIVDGSLIGEACTIIQCGFPLYSEAAMAYPSILPYPLTHVKKLKAWDFSRHLHGEAIVDDRIVLSDGFQYRSGWYNDHNYTRWCIAKLTGCPYGDTSCEDRHAYAKLIRGPFHKLAPDYFDKLPIVGVPSNLKKAILTLPHAIAPRLDAAVHLRCQFKNFEYGVGKTFGMIGFLPCSHIRFLPSTFILGPEDHLWSSYMKEVGDFLNSTAFNAGVGLFRVIEGQIMNQLKSLLAEKRKNHQRRRNLLMNIAHAFDRRSLMDGIGTNKAWESLNTTHMEWIAEHDQYHGDSSDRVYLYLASDNDQVKEAFAAYLTGHANISVMRIKTAGHISHAKSLSLLKSSSNGVFTLVMDWYCLSLANVVFAWRRDTNIISTFAQVCYELT